jgi:hypothetical protein
MLEILKGLITEYGQNAVVNNQDVPNDQNQNVLEEAQNSITQSLQQMAVNNPGQLKQMVDADGDGIQDTEGANNIANQFAGNIANRFGIPAGAAKSIAISLIPVVLGKLFGKAKDPNDKSIGINDILGGLAGGGGVGGILGGFLGGNQQNDTNAKGNQPGFGLDDLGKMFGL